MKNIFFVFLFFVSAMAYAGSGDFTIKSIGISENTYTVFVDVYEPHSQSECANKAVFRYVINKPDSLYKEIYSGLLAAKMGGNTVEINFSDNLSDCLYNSPQIRYIKIN